MALKKDYVQQLLMDIISEESQKVGAVHLRTEKRKCRTSSKEKRSNDI